MFLDSSRYARVRTVEAKTADGRTVKAVALRRLPRTSGTPVVIKENDQLDIMAQRRYDNPTLFWHIADANTELQANDLVQDAGRTITVPEQ